MNADERGLLTLLKLDNSKIDEGDMLYFEKNSSTAFYSDAGFNFPFIVRPFSPKQDGIVEAESRFVKGFGIVFRCLGYWDENSIFCNAIEQMTDVAAVDRLAR